MTKSTQTAVITLVVAFAARAGTAIDVPDYDFDWVVIGDPGNPPYPGPYDNRHLDLIGRGSVPYVYRIARTEVTSAQWVEFFNALAEVDPETAWDERPLLWGGRLSEGATPSNPRWRVQDEPDAGMWPCEVAWRTAARYCNWLCNGKAVEPWAFADGAYDTSTFGVDDDGFFTDVYERRPGALFFMPTIEEWKKAAHYDPNRYGPGEGGWWQFACGLDRPPTPGLPGEPGAQTTLGLGLGIAEGFKIPLESYPGSLSPMGLLDTSGGMEEWTSEGEPNWFYGSVVFSLGTSNAQHYEDEGLPFDHPDASEPDRIDFSPSGGPPHRLLDSEGLRVASVFPCTADFAPSHTVLDLDDIVGFLDAYVNRDPSADLAEPYDEWDAADVSAFVLAFVGGCW